MIDSLMNNITDRWWKRILILIAIAYPISLLVAITVIHLFLGLPAHMISRNLFELGISLEFFPAYYAAIVIYFVMDAFLTKTQKHPRCYALNITLSGALVHIYLSVVFWIFEKGGL